MTETDCVLVDYSPLYAEAFDSLGHPWAGSWKSVHVEWALAEGYRCVLAIDGAEVCGYIVFRRIAKGEIRPVEMGRDLFSTSMKENRTFIYSLVVAEAHRGRGIGTRMVRLAQHEAVRSDCAWIELVVRPQNAAAICLYERLGFVRDRVLDSYYPDGDDGIRMHQRLFTRMDKFHAR